MGVAYLDRPDLRPRRIVIITARGYWENDRISPKRMFMVQTTKTPLSPGLWGDGQWSTNE